MTCLHRYSIFLILIISAMSITTDTVPEFQFPCYVDVCTFPRQYCNSDRNERRCSPCTRSLCKKEDLPRACLYYCQVADQPATTASSPQKPREIESKWQDKSDVYLVYMVIFIAVTNTIVVAAVLFIAVWLLRYCGKKDKPPLSPMERFLSGAGEDRDIERPLLQDGGPQRHREVVLNRLESEQGSAKSLPPYSSKETQFVHIPQEFSKKSESTESDLEHTDSLHNSKRSIDKTVQVGEGELFYKNHVTDTFVSSPTRDKQHEYHEKPWTLGGNTEMFEARDSVLRTEEDVEETCLKH